MFGQAGCTYGNLSITTVNTKTKDGPKRLALKPAQITEHHQRLLQAAERLGWSMDAGAGAMAVPLGSGQTFRSVIELADFLSGLLNRGVEQLLACWIKPGASLAGYLGRAQLWRPVSELLPSDAPTARRMVDALRIESLACPIIDARRDHIWGHSLQSSAQLQGKVRSGKELFTWAAQNNLSYALDQRCLHNHLQRISERSAMLQGQRLIVPLQFDVIRHVDVCLAGIAEQFGSTIAPEQLCFSMAAGGANLDAGKLQALISGLRELGVGVAVSDLARGLKDLDWVSCLNPDLIRISRQMLDKVEHSPVHRATVRGLIDYADANGTPVYAERIDNPASMLAATELGINLMQGNGSGRLQSFLL